MNPPLDALGESHAGYPDTPASEPKSGQRLHALPVPDRWRIEPVLDTQDDSWLLSYLDVITLLLVMMVVVVAFAGPPIRNAQAPATSPVPAAQAPADSVPLPTVLPATKDPLAGLPLQQLGKDFEVIVHQAGVSFRINSELLFPSGSAVLAGYGLAALDTLVPVLNAEPKARLVVEGHTDNVPIQTERFASNWELSSGRAASVARHLISRGVDPQRLRVTGFADTRPLAANDTAATRASNRRVELVLESGLQAGAVPH